MGGRYVHLCVAALSGQKLHLYEDELVGGCEISNMDVRNSSSLQQQCSELYLWSSPSPPAPTL